MKPGIWKYVLLVLKYAFAGGILYYLLATGKLDLSKISEILERKTLVLHVVVSLVSIYALMALRWFCLLQWQDVPATWTSVVRIQCIGIFFSSFMPGAVGGDLIKAYYIAQENRNHRTRAILSIIVDRFVGLETLMIVSFVALVVNYRLVLAQDSIRMMAISIGLYLAASAIGLALIYSDSARNWAGKINRFRVFRSLQNSDIVTRIFDALNSYVHQKAKLLMVLGITVIIDVIFVYIFFAIGREMGESSLSLSSYFTAVPLGILAMTLPITPGGIGIGQGAFYAIFLLFGAASGSIGVTIISVYQIIALPVNLCFIVAYIGDRAALRNVPPEA